MQAAYFGNPEADIVLLQPVGDHDAAQMEAEYHLIHGLVPSADFHLLAFKVDSWNDDLSPWQAPPVFGNEAFAGHAKRTLALLRGELLPSIGPMGEKKVILGGYSLAGLFSLWAACRLDLFHGVAAVSPSLWFPGFTAYLERNLPQTGAVYLSLGDREERTRNPVMATVGNSIRQTESILKNADIPCTLEWNRGNHFTEPQLRTAKGFAWLMQQITNN